MKIAEVYIEYTSMSINRPFFYNADGFNICKGQRVEVKFANRIIVGFVSNVLKMSEEEINNLNYSLANILRIIDDKPLLNEESFKIAEYMSKNCVAPLISCFSAMLPSILKPKSNKKSIKYDYYVKLNNVIEVKGKKQIEALEYLKQNGEVLRSEFNKKYSCLNSFIKKEIVVIIKKEASKKLLDYQIEDFKELNEDQSKAVETISNSQEYNVFLLHGVTGSGKTEVFLHLANKVINENKQVLILVPEISLTPQMVSRVSSRFKDKVAIYHSSLNAQEKYEQFKLVYDKKVSIVVGTRSAIFMPFDNLGLIIIDEEHDSSYKQDSTPSYHARDIANFRAKYHNANLVLASATPSLETYARCTKNVYQLIELPNRINGEIPDIKLVDMKEEMRSGKDYLLSNPLKDAIYYRLQKNEQVIILLNRRGYSPILRCIDCGEIRKCPHCDMALNYHKSTNSLVCHTCGYSEPVVHHCPKCGSKNLKYLGLGTEKLEEYINELFPTARVLRMDADTTNRKNAHEKMLQAFGEHQYDILLGTQMISKGLDYENVTLVGIINGDALLNRSDYRCVELTFDLLVQSSGRSGRGKNNGEVLIQVYDPNHYAIKCALNNDYKTFFAQEMKFRHLGNYPPYTYLASIILTNIELEKVKDEFSNLLKNIEFEQIKKLGPIDLIKKKDLYRYRLILKSKDYELLVNKVNEISNKFYENKYKSKIIIDINPLMME